jgi:hypothetical protein
MQLSTLLEALNCRLYIAVDAVIGFLASNGLAAFPKSKADATLKAIEQARELLEGGK